jgi:putative chitinase
MKPFFDSLRGSFGPLSKNQVAGVEHLLKATDGLPLRHRAYILGTAWHETGPASSDLHMTPRLEIWGPTAAQKRYEGRKDLGNTEPGDGKLYMGRGYVQITGRANYRRASSIVGRDLVKAPSLALDPEISAKIIVHGMVNGWFTGRKMADFDSYVNMRRVVNGTDKAQLIADYAEKFEDALKVMPAKPVAPIPPPPDIEPPQMEPAKEPAKEAPPAPGKSIAGWLLAAGAALFAALAAWMTQG